MKRIVLLTCIGLLILAGSGFAAELGEADKPALDSALKWLNLCDAGEYAQCWETASAYFKGAVSKEQLAESLKGVRPPLGETVSRKVEAAEHATSLPGAPDGDYIVFKLAASFTKKSSAVETVTVMKDSDGEWRIAGYFIR